MVEGSLSEPQLQEFQNPDLNVIKRANMFFQIKRERKKKKKLIFQFRRAYLLFGVVVGDREQAIGQHAVISSQHI